MAGLNRDGVRMARNSRFLPNDGKMMAVDISAEPTLSSGTPRQLFDTGVGRATFDAEEYGVTADGKRFLLLKYLREEEPEKPCLCVRTPSS